jgi:hypothetical protein
VKEGSKTEESIHDTLKEGSITTTFIALMKEYFI